MADETPAAEVETPAAQPQEPAEPKTDDVPPEVRRALKAANKEAETLRLKLQEIEDRDKTEAQRLTERADAAEKRANNLEIRAVRLEIAAAKGLTPGQAKRLVGSTREELEADADELLTEFKPSNGVPPLDLGARQTPSGTPGMSQLIRKAAGRA